MAAFSHHRLVSAALPISAELEQLLRAANPWWEGKPGRVLPALKRWLFDEVVRGLERGLAPVIALRGPRQVGKTTLQEQVIAHLVSVGVNPRRIFRVQFDQLLPLQRLELPVLTLARWFEQNILGATLNESAHRGEPAYLFFDEVQNLRDWAPQVKALVDHASVRVMLTGSSALRIEQGRDSLAGRVTTLEMGTLLLREIAALRGFGDLRPALEKANGWGELTHRDFWRNLRDLGLRQREVRDQAFAAFSERGGYPFAHANADAPWEEIASQLNETIVRRVIQHDLRLGERGRKRDEHLLEALFRLSARYAGQAPESAVFINELRTVLQANVGWQRVLAYLRFLNDTLLIRLVPPLELRLKRRKGAPKICLSDHSLRASWLQEVVPLAPDALKRLSHLSDLAGHLAESVAGYFLGTLPNLNLAWFPKRALEPEVDFVISVGEYRIPLEVKYRQRVDGYHDTIGLRAFLEKTAYNAPFGLLVTLDDEVQIDDRRIVALPLSSLLLLR